MKTPAEVIGRNVKALREAHGMMTAEEFGARIGAILGRPWPRQAVYLLEQGDRRVTAEEVATELKDNIKGKNGAFSLDIVRFE